MPKVSVVVPTYREADNLATLVLRLYEALRDAELNAEIIIVDDNSPDDTPRVCAELAERFPIRLLVRTEERGLSSAVIAGMRIAQGDVVVCMDADLSHPPESVPELVPHSKIRPSISSSAVGMCREVPRMRIGDSSANSIRRWPRYWLGR